MECIKYIPGDLVKIVLDDKKQVVKVIGYDPTHKRYLLTNEYIHETRGCVSVKEDEIMLISLTPEILDNNKWKRLKSKKYTWWRVRLDNVYYFIKPNKDYPSIWEFCRGNTRRRFKKIKYVHQLQHFLFGLDLNSDMNL